MVRGDPECPAFCEKCRQDCRCNAELCKKCHTCDYNGLVKHYPHSRLRDACASLDHDCRDVMPRWRRNDPTYVCRMEYFPKIFSGAIIRIVIGDKADGMEPEERLIAKDILIENSEYFKSYFSFQEKTGTSASNEVVKLNTSVDDIQAFDMFIQYLYWKDYQRYPSADSKDDLLLHAKVYTLAERLQAAKLKRFSLWRATKICHMLDKSPKDWSYYVELTPEVIDIVYLHTPGPAVHVDVGTSVQQTKAASGNAPGSVPHVIEHFRILIATFCGKYWYLFRDKPPFLDRVREFPDFAVDLVTKLSNGPSLDLDSNGYLKVHSPTAYRLG